MITNPVRQKIEPLPDGRLQVTVSMVVDGKPDTRAYSVPVSDDADAAVAAIIKELNAQEQRVIDAIAKVQPGTKALDITPDVAEAVVEP